jgi:hypothetical protein
MKYQLVLQWSSSALTYQADYDRLLSLEHLIESGLDAISIVDGHDISSGEMNVFIHRDHPKVAFATVMRILEPKGHSSGMTAGYRKFEENEYTPVYPKDLNHFSVKLLHTLTYTSRDEPADDEHHQSRST